jgi:phospholipid-binding lipoprotein MlaA
VSASDKRVITGIGLILALGAGLAGCAQAPAPSGTNDPYETVNRAWFDTNLRLARAMTGAPEPSAPAEFEAEGETDADAAEMLLAPEPTAEAPRSGGLRLVSNFGSNLGLPSAILNDLLQIRPDRAVENTIRLVINTTIGLGGVFDPAGAMGVHGRSTDFGETLHRWGAAEGAYMVLPVYGSTTERDALGLAVDTVLDPLRFVLPRAEHNLSVAARTAGHLAGAAEYADILDANVINTADPYAQARLLHLQTRRYHLGIEAQDEIIDPYEDLYDF